MCIPNASTGCLTGIRFCSLRDDEPLRKESKASIVKHGGKVVPSKSIKIKTRVNIKARIRHRTQEQAPKRNREEEGKQQTKAYTSASSLRCASQHGTAYKTDANRRYHQYKLERSTTRPRSSATAVACAERKRFLLEETPEKTKGNMQRWVDDTNDLILDHPQPDTE
ncbi:hypothetical protein LTS18_008783, partial [Coniosporium uncinatum]